MADTDRVYPVSWGHHGGYLDLDRRPLLDADDDDDELEDESDSERERERCSRSPDTFFLLSLVSSSSSSNLYLETSTLSSCTSNQSACHYNINPSVSQSQNTEDTRQPDSLLSFSQKLIQYHMCHISWHKVSH